MTDFTSPIAEKFLSFVDSSPSPFHAVHTATEKLEASGFQKLKENQVWNLKPGNKYYYTRNQSTLVAFIIGGKHVSKFVLYLFFTILQKVPDNSSFIIIGLCS